MAEFLRSSLLVGFLIVVAVAPAVAREDPGADLSQYRWKSRLLVVFAPEADHPGLKRQKSSARRCGDGYRDRELKLMTVVGDTPVRLNGRRVSRLTGEALRARHGVGAWEFRIMLFGKDGGVKTRSAGPIPARRLFQTIDGMPMRRSEVRRRLGKSVDCVEG